MNNLMSVLSPGLICSAAVATHASTRGGPGILRSSVSLRYSFPLRSRCSRNRGGREHDRRPNRSLIVKKTHAYSPVTEKAIAQLRQNSGGLEAGHRRSR